METRTLGTSDVEVTPVALGAWAIGGWQWGGTDEEQALAAIRTAVDLGMTTIDTAPVYGFGRSEEVVGRAIAGRRDDVRILTKFGLRWDLDPADGKGVGHVETRDLEGNPVTIVKYAGRESVIAECEASLRRLGVETIDLFQQHWPDPSTPIAETMEACADLLAQGKIRAVGVSNYSPEQMEEARQVVPLASDQPPYSMLRRDIEDDVVPYCRKHDIGILAYSPLQNGILTGKVTLDRTFPDDDLRAHDRYYTQENRKRVLDFLRATVRPIAERHEATVAQVVIAWTIRQPGITCALVGCRKTEHAEDNARAAEVELTGEEVQRISDALDGLSLDV
jgi:aryl-alcohol dehydrogenase-like predicted oxidoreductase